MAFSFIHISDIHLGRPFSDLSEYSFDEKVINICKTAVKNTFNNFINFAIEKNVDFILIAGDTFDSKEQDFNSKLILKEGLKKLDKAGIQVYLICGNHDPITSYNKTTFNFDETSNIKIIGLNTPKYGKFIIKDKSGNDIAQVNAYSYFEDYIKENPINFFEPAQIYNKKLFNIGLLHCDLDADKSSPYYPVSKGELNSLNYDYWALGHIHVPFLDNNIVYTGTIQGRNTKETGSHGFRYLEVNNNSITNNLFISIDTVRFENIKINLSNSVDTTSAYSLIREKIMEFITHNKTENLKLFLVKLILEGNTCFYSFINKEFYNIISENLKEDFDNLVYISKFINNTKPEINYELLQEDEGISGELFRLITEENLDMAIENAENTFKNLLKNCNFSDSEHVEFLERIKKSAKDKCLIIANTVYNNESDKEE